VRLYDRLFRVPEPQDEDYTRDLNPDSLETLTDCYLEAGLRNAAPGSRYQFERLGYFSVDPKDSQPGRPVLNRIVPLRDSWAKIAGSGR
jgi:glutaminyl-tRNA synthetase